MGAHMEQGECILCGKTCEIRKDAETQGRYFCCEFCGNFAVTKKAERDVIPNLEAEERARLSCCTRERVIHSLPILYYVLAHHLLVRSPAHILLITSSMQSFRKA
jgi:hypothetical protein